ncbi:MAG: Tetratricopeptide repeat protein [Candidatus Angelobacter sp.]|nr:Tetratricopeptide repeat protein [Candidatus Angelobacter sp.]
MIRWIFRRPKLSLLVVILSLSSAYLYVFPAANLAYIAIVLLHAAVGLVAALFLAPKVLAVVRAKSFYSDLGWLVLAAGAILGVVLLFIGTIRSHWTWMYVHVVLSFLAVALLLVKWMGAKGWQPRSRSLSVAISVLCLAVAVGAAYGGWNLRQSMWSRTYKFTNPASPPTSMNEEGDGPEGLFFPSSSQTAHKGHIPGSYFMESDACQRCHKDIYNQWYGSVHHFSSFNNQWYRKSIEYMQDVVGVKPSKWCAGCHDPALLYSGMFDTPIKQIVDRPEARAGLGCMMCHSIERVKSTMGQGDFLLEYPRLHQLAASKNPAVRWIHDYVTELNPEPHRRVFLKPFMRTDTAEFCSTCHKVHLDVPVNHYRWIRGFNEYDNWQASGVSGYGARSFYYPPKASQCADCHMPAIKSTDAGAIQGNIHSHAFPGANTALPVVNEDAAQLELTKKFLKDSVTVDIFAIAPAPTKSSQSEAQLPSSELSTTFAVGEEAELKTPKTDGEALAISAPLNRISPTVRRGDTVVVEVVVRTRKVGHFFPGGTVDAYDTWLELKATDNKDRVLFWSGRVEDGGKGPVEKSAHFYRSLQVDAHGNPINKRNAWSSRAVVYTRLIPPGAADTVHYRLKVPADAGSEIKLEARLCYRKFAWWNTQFSFAGVSSGEGSTITTPDFDDRHVSFSGDTSRVSGNLKRIPDLPIVAVSTSQASLHVLGANAAASAPTVDLKPEDWTRWNDYGIGLFLQGNLKGARQAFEQVTRIDAANPDGWVNMGRVAVQEGDMEGARKVLEHALQLAPKLARANYFFARVLRAEGKYEEAATHLQTVLAQYPRDRVAVNDLGRILFLQRKYSDSIAASQRVLGIDPEDLQAHYNLMLSYQGMGDPDKAKREQQLYLRFKADESAQALTGGYRQTHPEDNNERQLIHQHESAPAETTSAKPARRPPAKRASSNHSSPDGE